MNRPGATFCDGCSRPVVVFIHGFSFCGLCFLEHSRGNPPVTVEAAADRRDDKQVVEVLARLAAALEASHRSGSPS